MTLEVRKTVFDFPASGGPQLFLSADPTRVSFIVNSNGFTHAFVFMDGEVRDPITLQGYFGYEIYNYRDYGPVMQGNIWVYYDNEYGGEVYEVLNRKTG